MAGRPSKLSEEQWQEAVRKRMRGQTIISLAAEYRVSTAAMKNGINARRPEIETVAKQVLAAENRFNSLPIPTQITTRSLIDDLRAISEHAASAAKYGMMTAHKLNAIAHVQSERLDETASLEENGDTLRSVIAMTEGANKAAVIGLNLLAANKEILKEGDDGVRRIEHHNVPDI